MHISRVQVEEGFLDGLDLRLSPGLNVIIGARGTGKTSLIELVRFCLGVRGSTPEIAKRSLEHARAVIGPGQVTVTLSDRDKRDIVVSRSALDDSPRATGSFVPPLIYSQTEIESLGLVPSSRLALIDGFSDASTQFGAEETRLISQIRSLTAEIASKRVEIEHLERNLAVLPDLERELQELAPKERALAATSKAAADKTAQLNAVSGNTAIMGVASAEIERFVLQTKAWRAALEQALRQTPAAFADPPAHTYVLNEAHSAIKVAREAHEAAIAQLDKALALADAAKNKTDSERLKSEELARELRREIEGLQQGAGAIARQGQQLRERKAQITALQEILDFSRRHLADLAKTRGSSLDELDRIRDARFGSRQLVATSLNARLAPRIRVELERAGQIEQYAATLATLLRGSGIRYNELSVALAKAVSPRELLEWAEQGDAEALSRVLRIPKDRAVRLLSALADSDLGNLAVLLVEDDARLFLLDGHDFKPLSDLSTGQRCTVVLPIVLERKDTVLAVDQPEDHIDNAFIADTLVKAILHRSNSGQLLVSTHNANIPVLGEAAKVVQLGSDGRRGYILVDSPLSGEEAVGAITGVMEGGAEAFRRRADFYERNEAEVDGTR